jgi:RNA polymerase sigma factor (sigma-70 family)
MPEQTTNVLLVEDDDGAHATVRQALEAAGPQYRLTWVRTIREAREALSRSNPALVIADLLLPDGRGTELLPRDPGMRTYPLVVLTAEGDEQATAEAIKAGALDCVVKSNVGLESLPRVASRVLREWRNLLDLRRSEESRMRCEAIIEAATDFVVMVDPEERLIAANPAARTRLGLDAAARPSLSEFLPPWAYQRIRRQGVPAAVRRGRWSGEIALLDRSESEVPAWAVLLSHPNAQGEVELISLVARDLSERKRLERESRTRALAQSRLDLLSPREREVLELVIAGKPNKVIARNLDISVKTVEMHRARIMKKLNVASVAELVRLAVTAENAFTNIQGA